MLRDKNLVPLSRQHQHALALCVRIDRASPIPESDLAAWQAEIAQHFRAEIGVHFATEEQFVFPGAQTFPELNLLVEELLSEHAWLREYFVKAESGGMSGGEIAEFASRLSAHIRKEERHLFERLQELMNEPELAALGQKVEDALKEAEQSCSLPAQRPRER
jgi:hemerythrin-like domain-containing protein